MKTIPLQELADYTMRLDLEGIPCDFRFYWVEFSEVDKPNFDTTGSWYMSISNSIFAIKDIKLVGGTELMWPYAHINFGGFVVYDRSDKNQDPEYLGMGNRWQLYYFEINEVDSIRQVLNLETI